MRGVSASCDLRNGKLVDRKTCLSLATGSAAMLPETPAAHETMVAAHLDELHRFKAAVEPLYAALAPDQKKTADTLMIGPIRMGMGTM